MSDAADYLRAHAVSALRKARAMPPSRAKRKQREVARVYHLLARCSAETGEHYADDFRFARIIEQRICYKLGN